MLTIRIINDGTGTPECANYTYAVAVNGKDIASGEVFEHERAKGWRELVRRILVNEEQLALRVELIAMAKLCGFDLVPMREPGEVQK